MKIFKWFNLSIQVISLREILSMSKNNEKVFYAVGRGKETGIYNSWKECKNQTEGISNAKYRKFYNLEEAEEFVKFWRNYSSGDKESNESKNLVSNVSSWKGSLANGRRNCYNSNIEKPIRSTNISYFSKNKHNFILGNQSNKEDCRNKSTLCATPYTSPLSYMSIDFISLKTNEKKKRREQNSLEVFKPKKPSNKFNQGNSDTPSSKHSEDVASLRIQSQRLKEDSGNFGSYECNKQSSSYSNISNTSLDVVSDSKNDMPPVQNSDLQSDPPNKSITSNESSLITPDDDNVGIVKKEVVDVDCNDQNESIQNKEEITEISDKLISCFKKLESVLKTITNQNSSVSEKLLRDFSKTMLERIFTNTNTNVNPQMEPEGNVNKICEEAGNCEMQPTESTSSPHQSSSNKPCEHLQSLSFHSTSFEGRVDQKNVDILALNLRLDSFEKRFDAFLKEIGAIASEISHLKAQIKELKEYSKPASTSGIPPTPKKDEDGMLQATHYAASSFVNTSSSWFHSPTKSTTSIGTDSEMAKKPNLKRKLSSSYGPESFKRFADNGEEIDDLLSKIKTEAVDYTSFTVDEDDYVEVYTDGAAQSNGSKCAKAGIGIWFGDNHPMNIAEAVVGRPTNNTAEIQAARVAIQLAIKAGISKLKIFTDSEFLINCATKWIDRWKRNGWVLSTGGPVKNRKELEKLDKAASKISVRWEKVMGHAGIKGNETADRLANEGAHKYNECYNR